MSGSNDRAPESPESPRKAADEVALPASPEAPKDTLVVVFHDAADLTLLMNDGFGKAEYKVSAMNLATASDVFRAIIFGKGRKPEMKANTTVELGDDVDVDALAVLFRIMHFDFAKVPTEVTLEKLDAITKLTAKYQCTNLLMPWASKWLSSYGNLVRDESCVEVNYKAANIAWELGHAKLLRHMVKNIISSVKIDSDGDLMHATGIKLKDLVLPPGILDEITTIRTSTIENILTSIQAAIDNVTNHTGAVKYCKTGTEAEKCETMMLGSAITKLLQARLFPVPSAATYKDSVAHLVCQIEGISLQHWEGRNYAPHASHSGCSLRFKENAKAAIRGMTDPLKEVHLEHLQKQSASSGVLSNIEDCGDSDEVDSEKPCRRTCVTDTISGKGELLSRSRSTSPKSTMTSSSVTVEKKEKGTES